MKLLHKIEISLLFLGCLFYGLGLSKLKDNEVLIISSIVMLIVSCYIAIIRKD